MTYTIIKGRNEDGTLEKQVLAGITEVRDVIQLMGNPHPVYALQDEDTITFWIVENGKLSDFYRLVADHSPWISSQNWPWLLRVDSVQVAALPHMSCPDVWVARGGKQDCLDSQGSERNERIE